MGTPVVCIVFREPYGSTGFQYATAEVNQDGSLDVLHADPDADDFEDVWHHYPVGTWKEATVKDATDHPLVSFVAADEQRKRDAVYAAAVERARAEQNDGLRVNAAAPTRRRA